MTSVRGVASLLLRALRLFAREGPIRGRKENSHPCHTPLGRNTASHGGRTNPNAQSREVGGGGGLSCSAGHAWSVPRVLVGEDGIAMAVGEH